MSKVVIRPVGGDKGLVFVTTAANGGGSPPVIKLPDGTSITGRRADSIGRQWVENTPAGNQYQYVFPGFSAYGAPVEVSFGGESKQITLSPNVEYRTESGGIAGIDAAPNKAVTGGMGGMGAAPGGLSPFGFGAGMSPAYLGGQYPFFQPVTYNPIAVPNYELLDPEQYGKEFGAFTRNELAKNFGTSREFTMAALDMELKSLKNFTPAAAALKRSETAVDNIFNQTQRTAQINQVLPDVLNNLKGQTTRAAAYAEGRLPDAIENEALTVATRSEAADTARAGGFGARSRLASTISDQMSARERFQISQYGESLIGQNAQTRAALELAPTSYSQSGQSINVNPPVSASSLVNNFLNLTTQTATLPAQFAFSNLASQRQFKTNLESTTDRFNASNTLQNDQFNATNVYQSQLGFFNYNQGFAANLAGLGTAEINQNREDAIRDKLTQEFENSMGSSQNRQTISGIIAAIGAVAPNLKPLFEGIFSTNGISPTANIDDFTPGAEAPPFSPSAETSTEPDFQIGGETPAFDSGYSIPSYQTDYFGVTKNGYSLGVDMEAFNRSMGAYE